MLKLALNCEMVLLYSRTAGFYNEPTTGGSQMGNNVQKRGKSGPRKYFLSLIPHSDKNNEMHFVVNTGDILESVWLNPTAPMVTKILGVYQAMLKGRET